MNRRVIEQIITQVDGNFIQFLRIFEDCQNCEKKRSFVPCYFVAGMNTIKMTAGALRHAHNLSILTKEVPV